VNFEIEISIKNVWWAQTLVNFSLILEISEIQCFNF
jgi:hypothetical protein